MTKYFVSLLLIFLCLSKSTLAQVPASAKAELITKINDTTIRVMPNAVVPKNEIFYIYDETGLVTTYTQGQRVLLKRVKDMVRTKCPKSFPRRIRCWTGL